MSNEYIASIVIPVFNGADCIVDCLDALNSQTIPREQYEIIVVDDGSTDDTAVIARKSCDTLVSISNSGPAAARNLGVERANGPVILFTDADCVPLTDWVEQMLEPFENPLISGVKGAYYTRQTEIVAQFVQAEYETKYAFMSTHEFIDFIDTYSAGFRTELFREMKGFDLRFPGASVEDQEFSFRLAEAGHKMKFIPTARVYHRHAWTLWRYTRKKFNIGYWKVLVLRLHPEKTRKDTHTPRALKLQLPLALMLIVSALSAVWLGGIPFAVLLSLFLCSGMRESIQCLRNRYFLAAMCSPVIMFCRATALGTGLVWGFLTQSSSRLDLT